MPVLLAARLGLWSVGLSEVPWAACVVFWGCRSIEAIVAVALIATAPFTVTTAEQGQP